MPVRRATPEDLPRIVDLAGMLFAEDSGTRDPYADVSWPRSPEGRAHYARHVESGGSCVLVAGATIVGFLAGALRPRDPLRPDLAVADLEVLYVIPGRRSDGVGAVLLDAYRMWANGRGANRLSVTASAGNSGARRFYRAHGFDEHTVTLEAPVSA